MLNKHILANRTRLITSTSFTFENLIERNCLYVDKTQYFWNMLNSVDNMYFLSRPRRFGKSLTLSTLKAIFQGKKELFKDLFIYEQPYDWKEYPVIHLDMGSVSSSISDELNKDLIYLVKNQAKINNIELSEDNARRCFIELINKLYERDGKVVILIDEYDKPILNNIEKPNLSQLQEIMKGFYSVIKTCEPYERFVFITGVGKFLKVSIFSDLNNLNDISMSDEYATMCGYTQKELIDNFNSRIVESSKIENEEYESFLQGIKEWYDGYRFSKNSENVYNPVSFAKFLENNGDFNNYWFETGSPSILIKLIKNKSVNIEEITKKTYSEDIFTAFMPSKISLIALMYQTGYLTIKSWEKDNRRLLYKLGFPNMEVEESFYRRLITSASDAEEINNSLYFDLCDTIKNNDIDTMMSIVDSFIAEIPYNIQVKNEKYYQTLFYSMFKLMGYSIHTEVCTNTGRIDAVIEYADNVYIFEFKLNQNEETAFEQIMEKEYYKGYQYSGKKITLIGANFYFSEEHKPAKWKKLEL